MSRVYNTWNDWFQAEKKYFSEADKNWVIHGSGRDPEEWEKSGMQNAEYSLDLMAIKPDETVLEYGCGNGRILKHIKPNKCYGVDIVPDFVQECKEQGLNSYLLEDFKETVDKVYSLTVFIHLKKHQAEDALKYIHNHLKEGGRAFLQVLIYQKDKDSKNFSDMTCYKKETFEKMAESCGFKIVKLWENEGDIDRGQYGKHHNKYSIFEKI